MNIEDKFRIAKALKNGEFDRARHELSNAENSGNLNWLFDTALSSKDPVGACRMLLELGADPNYRVNREGWQVEPILFSVARNGNIQCFQLFLDFGANPNALKDLNVGESYASQNSLLREISELGSQVDDETVFEFVRLLDKLGADFRECTNYLGEFLERGRMKALRYVIDHGASSETLKWQLPHWSAAFGTVDDIRALSREDFSSSTESSLYSPWQIAVARGEPSIIQEVERVLQAIGAPFSSRKGLLLAAVMANRVDLVRSFAKDHAQLQDRHEYGYSALGEAVYRNHLECARLLLAAGALDVEVTMPRDEVDFRKIVELEAFKEVIGDKGQFIEMMEEIQASRTPSESALEALADNIRSREMAVLLESFGMPSSLLSIESRFAYIQDRTLVGVTLDDLPRESYDLYCRAFRSQENGGEITDVFKKVMINCGLTAYHARKHFSDIQYSCRLDGMAIWCNNRFGQSVTLLPDDRILLIAGEHEDGCDPDFCIYNDVIEICPDGEIRVFGYPTSVFPPTDFHTATLVGEFIYIIGNLGYMGTRGSSKCPVYRLDTRDYRITPISTSGADPGRIYGHQAILIENQRIRIKRGKKIVSSIVGFLKKEFKEDHIALDGEYELNLTNFQWSRIR